MPKPRFEGKPKGEQVSLLFVGDVMAHSPQVAKAKGVNNYDYRLRCGKSRNYTLVDPSV